MIKLKFTLYILLTLLMVTSVYADLTPPPGSTSTETDAAYIRQDGTTVLSTSIPFVAGIMGSTTGVECAVPTELSMRLPPITVDGVDFNASPGDGPCGLGATIIRADMAGGEFAFISDTCDNQTVDISAVPSYGDTGEVEGYNDALSMVYERTFDVYMISIDSGEGILYLTIALMESEVNLFSDIMLSFVESRPTYLYKIDNFFNWNTTTCTYDDIPEAGSTITECTGNCDNGSTPTWGASTATWSYFLAPNCGEECGSGAWTGAVASVTHNSTSIPLYTWKITSGGGISTIGDIETTGTVIADSIEVGTLGGLSSWTAGIKAVSIIPDSSAENPVIGMGLAFQANVTPTESTWAGLSSGLYGGIYFMTPGVAYTGTANAAMFFSSMPGGGTTISGLGGVQNYILLATGATGASTITTYTGFSSGILDSGNGTMDCGTWTDFEGTTLSVDAVAVTDYYGLKIKDMTAAAHEPTIHWGVYNEDRTYLKNYVRIGENADSYAPGIKLQIDGTITDATQYHYGEKINLVADPSSDPTSYHAYAMDASLIFQPDFDSEGAYLYGGSLQVNTSNHITCVAGVHPYFTFNGDVTPDIDSYHIFRAWMPAMSKGHVDDFTGVSILGPTLTDTATAGQIYGIAISDLIGGTGIPYGIYISSFTDAGGYGIYSVPPIATENALTVGYLDGIPSSPANGMIWMESDGLHIYYNGGEQVVEIVTP